MVSRALLLAGATLFAGATAFAQTADPPEIIGTLVGPGASPAQPDLRLYGTDLGWTYEHAGELRMLFGDTWPHASSLCDGEPRNDDTIATLPLAPPGDDVPPLVFETAASDPTAFAHLELTRDGASIPLAYGQVPIGGFSDGDNAFAVFGRGEPIRCTARKKGRPAVCKKHEHLECTPAVGECLPARVEIPQLCDLASGDGCIPGTTCAPSPTGFCVDPTSSQHDGTPASLRFTVAHQQVIAVQDRTMPASYAEVATLATNKLINAASRTVSCFTGNSCGSDYAPGSGALLTWGRPFFVAEGARQARLYLMVHDLPLALGRDGRAKLRPRWFAGIHPETGEPLWSKRQSAAAPLALDGVAGGDPHEVLPVSIQMTFSWVGPPIDKWVMLYGGDLADYLLLDPANARPGPLPGAVQMRWADHPWGPWSAPVPHLSPGSPRVVGEPYGPGGVLFHPQCVDQGTSLCARSDPRRPPDYFLPGCPSFAAEFDAGRFYGASIIDSWTRAAGGDAADVYWNVSTWNPYAVVLVKSRLHAGTATPATCPAPRSLKRKGLPGKPARFGWCAG